MHEKDLLRLWESLDMLGKCIICGGRKWKFFEVIQDRYEVIRFYECQLCGLVKQYPMPSAHEVRYYNDEVYRQKVDIAELEKFERRRAEVQFRLLYEELANKGSMLDIGCSSGELLVRVREERPFMDLVGIEPIEAIAKVARHKGLVVTSGVGVERIHQENKFDLFTMVHSIEHMLEPHKVLYMLRGLSSERARLYIEVPNLFGDIALEKAHLYAFTKQTLSLLLDYSGWEPIWLKMHGAPKHPWLPCYLSIFAKAKEVFDYSLPLISPRGTKWKRKFAMLKRLFAMATYGGENGC